MTVKSTTKFVLSAVLFSGACTTSEPIDFTQNVPVLAPADAAMPGGGAAGATSQGVAGGNGQGGGAGGQAGGSRGATASGGVNGGAGGNLSSGLPDAGAIDARPAVDTSIDSTTTDAGINATWTDIYNRLLNDKNYTSNCTGSPCHNPGTQKGLDFSTQAKGYTTAKGKLVVGSPNTSKIVTQLSSGSMPQARPKMPAADLAVIKAWIMAGALDN